MSIGGPHEVLPSHGLRRRHRIGSRARRPAADECLVVARSAQSIGLSASVTSIRACVTRNPMRRRSDV